MSSKRFGKKKKDKEKAGAEKPKPAPAPFGGQKTALKGAAVPHTHFQRRTTG